MAGVRAVSCTTACTPPLGLSGLHSGIAAFRERTRDVSSGSRMRENCLSGSTSGMWKRSMVRIMRHRPTKGPETARPDLTHRATSRLYQHGGYVPSWRHPCKSKSREKHRSQGALWRARIDRIRMSVAHKWPLGWWSLLSSRTGHPFAASGSEEPSQKIEFVFSASPETIRREPPEFELLRSVANLRDLAACARNNPDVFFILRKVFMLPRCLQLLAGTKSCCLRSTASM